jgi:putative two-component system response regulator
MDKAGRKKVLVVDDMPSERKVVRQILAEACVVLEARDGPEAIMMARCLQPDLILLDIAMPKMDGHTICHAIKKDPITTAIPVVMLSALSLEENDVLSRKIGAADYIEKPFTERKLLDTLGKLLPAAPTSYRHSVSEASQDTLCPLA